MAFLAQVPMSELSSSSSVIRLLMAQISMPKHEVTLWVSRILSVVLAALYAIPLFGVNPYFCYRAALISSIVASTMLLWQRFPCVEVSKLLLEDSCYYLLYSTLFLTASPITLALLPLVMLTISQCCSATILKSFDLVVPTSSYGFNIFLSFMESQQENIIFCSACFEVILLFILAFMPFLEGLSLWSLLLPLIYYHLFHYRYTAEMNLLALYSKFYSIGLSAFVSVLFGNQLLFSARQHQRGGLCCIECRLQSSDCVMPTMMLLGHIPMGKMSRSPSIIELIASKTETTLWVSRTLSIMFATLYYTSSLFGSKRLQPVKKHLLK